MTRKTKKRNTESETQPPDKKEPIPGLLTQEMIDDNIHTSTSFKEKQKPPKSKKPPKTKSTVEDPMLAGKDLFRIDEVAKYFAVTDRCIRLWIEHGHLKTEKIVGTVRISKDSILNCRFKDKIQA